jgi:hypothetical protein
MKLVIWRGHQDEKTHLFWMDAGGVMRMRISIETYERAISGRCCEGVK